MYQIAVNCPHGELSACDIASQVNETSKIPVLLVSCKYSRTIRNEIMHFGTFFDAGGEFFDTVHFPQPAKQYPFKGRGVYLMKGRIVEEFGFPSVDVEKMVKLPFIKDRRYF